jgi:hypothetical protein
VVADDALGAVEAARRAGASDVGTAAVERLEQITDGLAVAYASTPPHELLSRAKTYLEYTIGLLGGRMTLAEHRRVLVTSGWLSLLAATSLIDLRRHDAATAYRATAAQIAGEAEHAELAAWCLETRAWQALITKNYPRAAGFARDAPEAAPRGTSVLPQAAAQEGRAWARLGAARETYDALARVEALVSPLPVPDQPEHHYVHDPAKAESYVATTLAWIGDPAAEGVARHVLERIESGADGPPRPRRAVAARLDLALALAGTGRPDEAAAVIMEAITSGWMVPSHCWRAEDAISHRVRRARRSWRAACCPRRDAPGAGSGSRQARCAPQAIGPDEAHHALVHAVCRIVRPVGRHFPVWLAVTGCAGQSARARRCGGQAPRRTCPAARPARPAPQPQCPSVTAWPGRAWRVAVAAWLAGQCRVLAASRSHGPAA